MVPAAQIERDGFCEKHLQAEAGIEQAMELRAVHGGAVLFQIPHQESDAPFQIGIELAIGDEVIPNIPEDGNEIGFVGGVHSLGEMFHESRLCSIQGIRPSVGAAECVRQAGCRGIADRGPEPWIDHVIVDIVAHQFFQASEYADGPFLLVQLRKSRNCGDDHHENDDDQVSFHHFFPPWLFCLAVCSENTVINQSMV